jgi:hypothetical protein
LSSSSEKGRIDDGISRIRRRAQRVYVEQLYRKIVQKEEESYYERNLERHTEQEKRETVPKGPG